MINIEELRRLAKEATPGPWNYIDGEISTEKGGVIISDGALESEGKSIDDAFYVAAANPAVILELIEILEREKEGLYDELMPADEAIMIASLWRAGKMIGGDPFTVCDALLLEVNRLMQVDDDIEREGYDN